MDSAKTAETNICQSCSQHELRQDWVLMRGMNELRSQRVLTDVTLIVEGKPLVPCHRAILAASSPYFQAMFVHNLAEQNKPEIEMKEMNHLTVSNIIDYLYTGKILITDHNAQDLITASSILQIPLLYGKCSRYMQKRLTVQNCIDMYSFAKCLCCTELQSEAFSMICRRFADICQRESFFKLSKEDIIDFLSSDDLSVDKEEIVYEAALSWIVHDIHDRGKWMSEVLSYIRFVLLDDTYLENCIMNEQLISEFSNLSSQLEAAQRYKAKVKANSNLSLKKLLSQNGTSNGASFSLDKKENEESQGKENENLSKTGCIDNNRLEDETKEAEQSRSSMDNDFTFSFCPYYEITRKDSEQTIKIPLETLPRAGMIKTDMLLFTNGRKTVIFDPIQRCYYSGVESSKSCNNGLPSSSGNEKQVLGIDMKMPEMKNVEVYAARNETLYLIGGLEVDKSTPATTLRSRFYIFNENELKWRSRRSLEEPRCMIGLGELNNCLVMTGGKILSNGEISSLVQTYDIESDAWSELPSLPNSVYGHQCASVNKRIYVIGGKTNEQEILNFVYFLTSETNQWTQSSSLNIPRFLAGSTVLRFPCPLNPSNSTERELIYVVGGVSNDGLISSVEVLDCSEDKWNFTEKFPESRCAQFASTINGKVCAVGGHVSERNDDGRYVSIEKYDAFILEEQEESSESSFQWRRIARHIRGIYETPFACCGIKINKKILTFLQNN